MLVLDSGVVLAALLAHDDELAALGDDELVAPPLLWSQVRSVLHEARWRGELDAAVAGDAHRRLAALPVAVHAPAGLGDEAWRIADELGLAKTYDAEFLALARLLKCRLVTTDRRLRRGADRLGFVVGPTELGDAS